MTSTSLHAAPLKSGVTAHTFIWRRTNGRCRTAQYNIVAVWSADAAPNLWYDLPDRHLCHETWSFHARERSDCLRQGDDAVRVRSLLLGRATAERDEALARARKGTRQRRASCASQA